MIRGISWRNIWRNRGRSMVVIVSIAIGIWVLIFMFGFMNAFMDGYVESQVRFETSRIQIHHPEFKKDYEIKYTIKEGSKLLTDLQSSNQFNTVAVRSVSNGMITSPRKANGVRIIGVEPDEEKKLFGIDTFLVEGKYFEDVKRNPIVIGHKTAEKLKVKLKSKVVLTFQDVDGQIVAGAFRVCGIVKVPTPTLNEFAVHVRRSDLNKLLNIGDQFHEIAMITNEDVDEMAEAKMLSEKYPNQKIESWIELAPELKFFQESSGASLIVLQIIVMLALIFGIINTMLMSVLERYKELGVLMAIGMNRTKVFYMVMTETIFLALVGSPLGFILSWLTMNYLGSTGLDLSNYSEGIEIYGFSSILYPSVDVNSYVQVLIGVFITALLGAIYPAYKAIKLKPVEALHKI